jgi:hypothetical protein
MEVTGIWLRKQHAHLGNNIEVLIEVDGDWRLLTRQVSDTGPISHIFEEGAMEKAEKE